MPFDFDNLEDNENELNEQILNGSSVYTDANIMNLERIDPHDFLKSKGCFCAKIGFYLGDLWPILSNSHSGEFYIEDPRYYLEKDGKRTPEAANFSIVYLEPDRQDISKPLDLHISDQELEYPALVFQQLIGEILPDGVIRSTNRSLNKACYVFLGIFKIEKVDDSSTMSKYRLIKIGDTFYFDSSKKAK